MTERLKDINWKPTPLMKALVRTNHDTWGLIDRMHEMIESSGFDDETKANLKKKFDISFMAAFAEGDSPDDIIITKEPSIPTNGNGHSQEPISKKEVIFQDELKGLTPTERRSYLDRRENRRLGRETRRDGRAKVLNPLRRV